MRVAVAQALALCIVVLHLPLSAAWVTRSLRISAAVPTRKFAAGSAWTPRHPSQPQSISGTATGIIWHRVSRPRTVLLNAAAVETTTTAAIQQQPQLQVDATVDRDADTDERSFEWVLSNALESIRTTPDISNEDVRLAYECFYNVSVATAEEGVKILLANTGLFLSKNVTELYTRCLETAPEDHVANLSAGLTVVLSYVESFAESWGQMMDHYRTLLKGAVNATSSSAEALDRYIQEHKADLTAPGFGRFLQGEMDSVTDEPVKNFLRYLQVRIISEQEASYPEEVKTVSRLLSLTDAPQRQSELEYFIRSATDPPQRAKRVLDVLDSALQEASGMQLMTATGLEATALLRELMQVAKSVAQSLNASTIS